jgi:hypothetical protein
MTKDPGGLMTPVTRPLSDQKVLADEPKGCADTTANRHPI